MKKLQKRKKKIGKMFIDRSNVFKWFLSKTNFYKTYKSKFFESSAFEKNCKKAAESKRKQSEPVFKKSRQICRLSQKTTCFKCTTFSQIKKTQISTPHKNEKLDLYNKIQIHSFTRFLRNNVIFSWLEKLFANEYSNAKKIVRRQIFWVSCFKNCDFSS